MSTRTIPWVEKYRPRRIEDVAGNPNAKKKFVAWLNLWMRGSPTKKAALLYGPPGTGKTSIVYAAAVQYDLELIEANASDVRSSEALRRKLYRASRDASLWGKRGRIILLDEVDGISTREDTGGLQMVKELINISRHPIVLTANDPWDPKLRTLRQLCELIEFRKLGIRDILPVLQRICEAEGIKCSRDVLRALAERSRGDLRSAINDLQSLAMGKKSISIQDLLVLGTRAAQHNMFELVRYVLAAKSPQAALSVTRMPSFDYEMFMQWLNENIPFQYYPSLRAISDAYDALSKADIYLARAKLRQKWSLLPFALELMTVGVASARDKPPFKFVRYDFPNRLRILRATKDIRERRRRIERIIANKCHVSTRTARIEIIPFLKLIAEENEDKARKIISSLGIPYRLFKEAYL